jgi:hypothetical protein
MVVVLVEVLNAQTSIAQAAWMVVVEVTGAFMDLIIAERRLHNDFRVGY